MPRLPERFFLLGRLPTRLKEFRQFGSLPLPASAYPDAHAMGEPGALTAAINWYRARPLTNMRRFVAKTIVPTMYVWSDGDIFVLANGARACGRHVSGEYRFETLHGVSHWMLDEQPNAVADLLLDWFATHPT
jgi:pimeloyl-ACP methyl ester carboxylesterase